MLHNVVIKLYRGEDEALLKLLYIFSFFLINLFGKGKNKTIVHKYSYLFKIKSMTDKQIHRFKIASYLTIGIVVFLIWVGGFVRSTGAGMGCPDWPKCFGMWVPPTCECQISQEWLTTHHLNGEKFNVYKTWTEYINRLIGALTGLFILGMFITSLPYRKTQKYITWLSGLGVILVGFEGWLGKKVVDLNLHTGMITIHMVVAMILLMVLIAAYLLAFPPKIETISSNSDTAKVPKNLFYIGIGVAVAVLSQIVLGTQVRENVDVVAKAMGETARGEWLQHLGDIYRYHTSFYWLIVLLSGIWLTKLRNFFFYKPIAKWTYTFLFFIFAEIALGMSLDSLGMPKYLQPFHLVFATLIFASAVVLTGKIYYFCSLKDKEI